MGLRGIVRVVNREGAPAHDLTDTACFAGRLTFSPDSRSIAYSNCLRVEPQLTLASPHSLPIQITSLGSNENPSGKRKAESHLVLIFDFCFHLAPCSLHPPEGARSVYITEML